MAPKRKGPTKQAAKKTTAPKKAAKKTTAPKTATKKGPSSTNSPKGPVGVQKPATTNTPSLSQAVWADFAVSRLIQECQLRNISLEGGKTKLQVVKKLNEYSGGDAASSAQPFDWDEYLFPRLQQECEHRNLSWSGAKKDRLVSLLNKNATGAPAAPAANGATAPATNGVAAAGTIGTATPATTTRGAEIKPNYDRRRKVSLVQLCADRGIPGTFRLKKDYIALLEKYDANPTPLPEEWEDPFLTDVRHARGATLSPTASDGPRFLQSTAPGSVEMIADVRGGEVWPGVGPGFVNEGNWCYRNAVLVVLLHSGRLMSWIENHYKPQIEAAGIILSETTTSKFDGLGNMGSKWMPKEETEKPVDLDCYTDVWIELSQLSQIYRNSTTSATKLENAKALFWAYMSHPNRRREYGGQPEILGPRGIGNANQQQDATEFLNLMIRLGGSQLDRFRDRHPNPDPAEINGRILREINNVTELLQVSQTARFRCVTCSAADRTKYRQRVSEESCLTLGICIPESIPDPEDTEETPFETSVTIEECLVDHCKNFQEGGRCEECDQRLENDKKTMRAAAADDEEKAATERRLKTRTDAINSTRTYSWKRFCRLPELLFISLSRYGRMTGTNTPKDNVTVEFSETLDMGPYIEMKRGFRPKGSSTYRLVGIVNHRGGLGYGHYVAQVNVEGEWYEFNDKHVSNTTLEIILEEQRAKQNGKRVKMNHRWTPYLLMYEKIAEDEEQDEDESDDDDDENTGAQGDNNHKTNNKDSGHPGSKRPQNKPSAFQQLDGAIDSGTNESPMFTRIAHLYDTPYVQDTLRDVFTKMEKHFFAEICKDVRKDVRRFTDVYINKWHEFEDVVAFLTNEFISRQDIVDMVSKEKRRRRRRMDGLAQDGLPVAKRARRTAAYNNASVDVQVGKQPSDFVYNPQWLSVMDHHLYRALLGEDEELEEGEIEDDHDADTELSSESPLPHYMSEMDDLMHEYEDVRDSDSESMSISSDELEPPEGMEYYFPDPLPVAEEFKNESFEPDRYLNPASTGEQLLRQFADYYAMYHGIARSPQGPWWWMGPKFDQDYQEAVTWYAGVVERRSERELNRRLNDFFDDIPPPAGGYVNTLPMGGARWEYAHRESWNGDEEMSPKPKVEAMSPEYAPKSPGVKSPPPPSWLVKKNPRPKSPGYSPKSSGYSPKSPLYSILKKSTSPKMSPDWRKIPSPKTSPRTPPSWLQNPLSQIAQEWLAKRTISPNSSASQLKQGPPPPPPAVPKTLVSPITPPQKLSHAPRYHPGVDWVLPAERRPKRDAITPAGDGRYYFRRTSLSDPDELETETQKTEVTGTSRGKVSARSPRERVFNRVDKLPTPPTSAERKDYAEWWFYK